MEPINLTPDLHPGYRLRRPRGSGSFGVVWEAENDTGDAVALKFMRCVRGHTEIYIEVSGIRALWEHVRTFKERHKIRDLFERDYGMTEFHIEDPNGCLVFVGEPTPQREISPGNLGV